MKDLDNDFDVLAAIQRVSNPPEDILLLIETQIQQEAKIENILIAELRHLKSWRKIVKMQLNNVML